MNARENGQRARGWLKLVDEGRLRAGTLEQGLQNIHLWRVVVSVQLLVVAMLVAEHATSAIHALLGVVEGPAVFALELVVVDAAGSLGELLLSVGESALALIPTLGSLNPVLAKLGFILAIGVKLHDLGRCLEALTWVESLGLTSVGISNCLVCVEGGLLAEAEWLGRYLEALSGICRLEAACLVCGHKGRRRRKSAAAGHKIARRRLEWVARERRRRLGRLWGDCERAGWLTAR